MMLLFIHRHHLCPAAVGFLINLRALIASRQQQQSHSQQNAAQNGQHNVFIPCTLLQKPYHDCTCSNAAILL